MSKMPVFKMPKIKHESVKHRKDFIMDLVFITVGISVLQVSLNEDFTDGIKPIHKNKYRKELAKIREVFEMLNSKKDMILNMLSERDLYTIQHKVKQSGISFIRSISTTEDDVCLEHIALSIFKQGLTRDRKTKMNDYVRPFCSFMVLSKIAKNVRVATNYDDAKEWAIVKDFVREVKY